jgi:hypothetical protein
MATELLPDENPALLPDPDRVELYPVLEVHDLNRSAQTRSRPCPDRRALTLADRPPA